MQTAPGAVERRSSVVLPLQFLRAVAAIAVATWHFQFDLRRFTGFDGLPDLSLGATGVDLFFVISGFVMVYTAAPLFGRGDAPREFLSRRLIRIVPLYWIVTTIYLALSRWLPGWQHDYSAARVLGSFLFVPVDYGVTPPEPVVGQGWTLNYEMLFYVIFASCIVLRRAPALIAITSILIGLTLIGWWFRPLPVPWSFWSDPIILEFAFGLWIGAAHVTGARLPRQVCVALLLSGLALLFGAAHLAPGAPETIRAGIPMMLIVAGSALHGWRAEGPLWRGLARVGDASYALYLLHAFPIRAIIVAALWLGWLSNASAWLWLSLAVTLAIAIAIAVNVVVEAPLQIFLKRNSRQGRSQLVAP